MQATHNETHSELDAASVRASRKNRWMSAGLFTGVLVILMVLGGALMLYMGVMNDAVEGSRLEEAPVQVASTATLRLDDPKS